MTAWEFVQGGSILACQQVEGSGGTHAIVVTENGAVIERHEIREDPTSPGAHARRLNEMRDALRGIYQRRFAATAGVRRKKPLRSHL